MAKLTGQFTTPAFDANNNKINKPFLHGVVFVFQGATKVTRESDDKGKYSFDLANGEYDVSVYLKGNTEKDRFDMRPGEKFVVTSTTKEDALDKWLQVIGDDGKDELAAYYENLLAQMQAVHEQFQDETQSVGRGRFIKEGGHGFGATSLGFAKEVGIETSVIAGNTQTIGGVLANGYSIINLGYATNLFTSRLALSVTSNKAWFKGGTVSQINNKEWNELYHSANTIIDSNGNIKAASPIVKLFANKIEHSGFGDEKPVFEKLDIGVYKISNTLGLAKGEYDGDWYIETPKDKNGDVLFNIEWSQDEDNNVIIRTYKRREIYKIVEDEEGNIMFGEKRGILNGDPIDINDGRFVSLRFYEDPEVLEAEIAKQEAEMEE